jgi:hypothetical protein
VNDYQAIPEILRARPQFVVWRYRHQSGSAKPKKVPFIPRSPEREASVSDPQTWGTFEESIAAIRATAHEPGELGPLDGLGFVFTPDDPLCGDDFDDCIVDGEMHPAAAEILAELRGYKELSPSGTGMHAITIATHNGRRHKTKETPWGGGFECYDRGRFFTVTGTGDGIPEPQQEQHDTIVARLLPPRMTSRTAPTQVGGGAVSGGHSQAPRTRPTQVGGDGYNGHRLELDDQELLRLMFAARNGPKVQALYDGDISAYRDDRSAADFALCRYLAFWTGPDPDRIDSLFRDSRLMRPKWDSPRGETTYGRRTIEKAIDSCPEFYSPPAARKRTNGTDPATGSDDAAAVGTDLYRETPSGLIWQRRTSTGKESVRLTNFSAWIVADTLIDYGLGETKRMFTLQARLENGETRELEVPAGSFPGMKWVAELGAHAQLWPGHSVCDRARHAIQQLSDPADRRVYAHTGWIKLNREDVFLHAGGGIGPRGLVPDIEVRLPEQLHPLELPAADGPELEECIRASLDLLNLGPLEVMAPLLGSAYRAPLGTIDLTSHAAGPTGAFKTELAALGQQHFGAGFDSRHLPGSWSSTANSNADLLFVAKDVLLVIDDFAPTGSRHDVQKQHRDAERVIRGQGNQAGRGRMNADGSQRPARPPRGLLLSTGEDVPGQQSLRARIVVINVDPGAIDRAKLLVAQARGGDGVFAKATAGYLQWLAANGIDRIRLHVLERARYLRESVTAGEHRRSAANLAQLACGLEVFLTFATETGAITVVDGGVTWERCWLALMRTASTQSEHQRETDPPRLFLSHLGGAIMSGRAYLDGADGGPPGASPEAWGYRGDSPAPGADRIGWVKDEDVYLQADASYRVAQRFADDSAQPLSHQKLALQKMLLDAGLIRISNEKHRYTVKRTVDGIPGKRVLELTPAAVKTLQGADDTDRRGLDEPDPAFPPIPAMTSVTRPDGAR